MPFATYDPQKITISYGNNTIIGFSPDSVVKVTRNEDAFSLQVGADGRGARSKNANRSGTVEISLLASSPSNDVLSAASVDDEANGDGTQPLQIKDGSGTSIFSAQNAWIKKFADGEFAKELSTRTWILESDAIDMFVGGTAIA